MSVDFQLEQCNCIYLLFQPLPGNVLKGAVFPQYDRVKDSNKEIANKEIVRKVKKVKKK